MKDVAEKKGSSDSDTVRTLKGLVRRSEAKATCRFVGIPDSNVHFLDLPFYETGEVKKKPLGQEDIDIVANLIEDVKPHQVFAACDIADPHGTHKVCLDILFINFRKSMFLCVSQKARSKSKFELFFYIFLILSF